MALVRRSTAVFTMPLILWTLMQAIFPAPSVRGDAYLHNPRGSNDRNCERNANRENGNRLFDSQNNNAGGYACPRGVGDETFQNEMGDAAFERVDINTGESTTFIQNKRMYYYEGSILPIEWTDQHGCGSNGKVACEIVLQYACEDTLDPMVDDFWPWIPGKAEKTSDFYGKQHFRSGSNIAAPRDGVPRDSDDSATNTIPDTMADATPSTKETRRYGMQESYDFYQLCQFTDRNRGLYTADQVIRRNDKRGTRQNPNGNRHGFECPEERDYYPWWHPSPWIDIAVLSDAAKDSTPCFSSSPVSSCSPRCQFYMNNTMNFNKKGYCDPNHTNETIARKTSNKMWNSRRWYNNKDACVQAGFKWYEVSHSDNLQFEKDNFVCAKTQYSRENQLGNARADDVVSQSSSGQILKLKAIEGVDANRFIWQIPKIPKAKKSGYFSPDITTAYKSCVLRMRYNISTMDFQQWPRSANPAGASRMVDSKNNSRREDDPNTPLQQDPFIYVSPGDGPSFGDMFLSLAVNTNQYGRTFEDRTYVFSIKPLPTVSQAASTMLDTPRVNASAIAINLKNGGRIFNVNVRGKRGNIVQTFPSVEYDFVPNALSMTSNDMIHFQWTGSDYNPRRGCNNGEGGPPDRNTFSTDGNAQDNSRADRSNLVFMTHMGHNVPKDYLGFNQTDRSLSYSTKLSIAKATVLSDAPCYRAGVDSTAVGDVCYEMMMRLAYLNQQRDGGSIILRAGKKCLTETELNSISNKDTSQNHPLNCAKINAKPFPYYDAGIMFLKNSGWFPFFSSRNNNFSNRAQAGILCVRGDKTQCPVDSSTGVLQDSNPEVVGTSVQRASTSSCKDTGGANAQMNCISTPRDPTVGSGNTATILAVEVQTQNEGDNDALGDGQKTGCEVLMLAIPSVKTVEQQLALAFILLGVGLFASWLAYFLYNRWYSVKSGDPDFRGETDWQKSGIDVVGSNNNPSWINTNAFGMSNPYFGKSAAKLPTGDLDLGAERTPTDNRNRSNSGNLPGRAVSPSSPTSGNYEMGHMSNRRPPDVSTRTPPPAPMYPVPSRPISMAVPSYPAPPPPQVNTRSPPPQQQDYRPSSTSRSSRGPPPPPPQPSSSNAAAFAQGRVEVRRNPGGNRAPRNADKI